MRLRIGISEAKKDTYPSELTCLFECQSPLDSRRPNGRQRREVFYPTRDPPCSCRSGSEYQCGPIRDKEVRTREFRFSIHSRFRSRFPLKFSNFFPLALAHKTKVSCLQSGTRCRNGPMTRTTSHRNFSFSIRIRVSYGISSVV